MGILSSVSNTDAWRPGSPPILRTSVVSGLRREAKQKVLCLVPPGQDSYPSWVKFSLMEDVFLVDSSSFQTMAVR